MLAVRAIVSALAVIGSVLLGVACATPRMTQPGEERVIELDWVSVSVVCDKVTGNLVYVAYAGTGVGMAVVEKGCVAK